MVVYDVKCNECGLHLDCGTGSIMYATNAEGERIICPHPGEIYTVRSVIGDNASEDEYRERTGHLQKWLCLSCLQTSSLDFERDPHICSHCGSASGESVKELIDKPCPGCKVGTIELFDTGIIT